MDSLFSNKSKGRNNPSAKPGITERILVVLAEIIFLVLLTFFSELVA